MPTSNQVKILLNPSSNESYILYDPDLSFVKVRAHGALCNTDHRKAKELASMIKSVVEDTGRTMSQVKRIDLESCFGLSGGIFSQAAILSSYTGVKVYATTDRYSLAMQDKMRAAPMNATNVVVRIISKKGNKILYHASESFLAFKNRLRNF